MDPEQRDTVLYIMDIITVSGGVIPRSTLGPTGLPRTVDIDPMRPPPYPTPPHASHPISPTRVAPADFYATASAQAAVPTQGASQGLQPQRQAHQQRPHAQPQMQQRQQRPGHDAAHRQTGPSQGVYGRQEAHGTAPEGLAASQRSIPAVSTARGPVAASAAPNLQTPSSAPVPAPASPAAAPSPRGPPGSASPRPAGPSQPVADLLGTSPPQPAPAAPRHTPPASPASGSQQQTPAASAPPPAAAPSQGADGGLDIFSGSGSQAAVPVGDLFDIHGDADASAHAGLDMDEGILGMFAAPLEPAAADSNCECTRGPERHAVFVPVPVDFRSLARELRPDSAQNRAPPHVLPPPAHFAPHATPFYPPCPLRSPCAPLTQRAPTPLTRGPSTPAAIYTDDSGFQRQPGEPEERWRARVARLKAERESVAKALREQQKRDQEEAQLKEEAYERKRELRSEVEAWKAASKGNVRALLGSLDKILWEGSGWKGGEEGGEEGGERTCACLHGVRCMIWDVCEGRCR